MKKVSRGFNSGEAVCDMEHTVVADTPQCDMEHILADFEAGTFSREIDDLTAAAVKIQRTKKRGDQALSVIVAEAGRQMSAPEWKMWAVGELGMSGSNLFHHRKIGKMLLYFLQCSMSHYRKLFPLDHHKQLSISRINVLQIPVFLSANDVGGMAREQVRKAVNAFLGEPEPERVGQPELPGLDELLGAVDETDDPDRINDLFIGAASGGRAEKCLRAGLYLAGGAVAALAQEPTEANLIALTETQKDLREEADELDEIIEKMRAAVAADNPLKD